MHLDRTKQYAMLSAMAAVYPRYASQFSAEKPTEEELANLWYLREQGLVEGSFTLSIGGAHIFQGSKITAKGLDFLADDGGLTAILGTITVRLHADTIKELLLLKVESSAASPEKKTWLRKQLDTASSEAIRRVINALLDEGVKHAPDLIRLVEQATRSAA